MLVVTLEKADGPLQGHCNHTHTSQEIVTQQSFGKVQGGRRHSFQQNLYGWQFADSQVSHQLQNWCNTVS